MRNLQNQFPRVSVIIPTYNAERTIAICLKALMTQTVPLDLYDVIVVDDGSVDSTCGQVEKFKGVQLFQQQNSGPAQARNLGIEKAQGDIVLFTDDDCEPTEDWIERMVSPFNEDEIAGVKGTYLTKQRELVPGFVQLEFEEKYARMAQEKYIDFIDTYSAGYRKSILLSNNGFDTTFPVASTEDQELSFRLAQQGFKMVFQPNAKVYHLHHPKNLREYWQKKFNIGYWKVVVHLRHPKKIIRDSHTPQILKFQIILIGFSTLLLIIGYFWNQLWWLAILMGVGFVLTTLPFVFRAWQKEPRVAVISPFLLFVRALALGTGFAAGLLFNLRK